MIGQIVKVIVDRPLGSYHPEHKDLYYPINNDIEEKWVVVPEDAVFSKEEIAEQVKFQEQFFESEIIMM